MKKILALGFVVMAIGAASFGCSSTSTTKNGATASDGGAGDGATTTTAMSCAAILSCAGDCADEACQDACLASGTPDGKTKASALADCINANSCADVDCVKASCASQLSTCLDSSNGGGTAIPPGTAPATGSISGDIVGEWFTSSLSWTFNADGTVSRYNNVNTAGCVSSNLEKGVGVVSGDVISVYFTSGISKLCGATTSDPYKAHEEDFTFKVEPSTTTTTGNDILRLAYHTCSYDDPSSIGLYCTDSLDRK